MLQSACGRSFASSRIRGLRGGRSVENANRRLDVSNESRAATITQAVSVDRDGSFVVLLLQLLLACDFVGEAHLRWELSSPANSGKQSSNPRDASDTMECMSMVIRRGRQLNMDTSANSAPIGR
jgi:hypothetical protein